MEKRFLTALGALAGWYMVGEGVHHYQKLRTIERIRKEVPKGSKILNLGCKNFWVSDPDYKIINIDVVPRKVPNFQLADVRNLPFPDKSFDCLLASHLLEHLPITDVPKAMGEMRRVVKDPKRIYIVLPSAWFPQTHLHPTHHWVPIRGRMMQNRPLQNWAMLGAFLYKIYRA